MPEPELSERDATQAEAPSGGTRFREPAIEERPTGARFRQDPAELEVETPPAGGRRFRFTIEDPAETPPVEPSPAPRVFDYDASVAPVEAPVVEETPAPAPQPVFKPEPVAEPAPQPVFKPEPAPVSEAAPVVESAPAAEERLAESPATDPRLTDFETFFPSPWAVPADIEIASGAPAVANETPAPEAPTVETETNYDHDWANWTAENAEPVVESPADAWPAPEYDDNQWNALRQDDAPTPEPVVESPADAWTEPQYDENAWAPEPVAESPVDAWTEPQYDENAWAPEPVAESPAAAWTEPQYDENAWAPEPVAESPADAWTEPQYDENAWAPEPVAESPAEAWTGEYDNSQWTAEPAADGWTAPQYEDDQWAAEPAADGWTADNADFGSDWGADDYGQPAQAHGDERAVSAMSGANDASQPWWLDQGLGGFDIDATLGRLNESEPVQERAAHDMSDLFATDADLDEPELDEVDWAAEDDFAGRSYDREPRGRRDRNPRERNAKRPSKGKGRAKPQGKGSRNAPPAQGLLQHRKVVVVAAVVLVLVILSSLGSDFFKDVVAAEDPNASIQLTCASAGGEGATGKAADLQSVLSEAPAGFTVVPDHKADTGVVDFSKAIKAEPDAANALAFLDQTRFLRGYNRSFTSGPVTATVAVYEFGSDVCASDYVGLHASDAPAAFPVDGLDRASGSIESTATGRSYVVRASHGTRAMIVSWHGDGSEASSVAGVTALAKAQKAAFERV